MITVAAGAPVTAQPLTPDDSDRWTTLFNQDRYHALNLTGEHQRVLHARVADADGRLLGALSGVLEDGVLLSGFSAPFGGVDLVRHRETAANVGRLVDGALVQIREAGAHTVRVRLPPPCHGESEGLIQFTLLNRGFTVERCDLNQHIELDTVPTPEAYVAALRSPARRALRRLADDPAFSIRNADVDGSWHEAHALLAANRARKGRTLALSQGYLDQARAALGGRIRMLRLHHGDTLVAAALIYRVREARDLVVAWGDGDHDLDHSPMNLLAFGVVRSALQDGVRAVDLGISNGHEPGSDGALLPDAGLVQFKQSLLARTAPRLTLARTFTTTEPDPR